MIAIIVGLIITLVALTWDAINHNLKVKKRLSGFLAIWLISTLCVGLPVWGAYSFISWAVFPSTSMVSSTKAPVTKASTAEANDKCVASGAVFADVYLANLDTAMKTNPPILATDVRDKGCLSGIRDVPNPSSACEAACKASFGVETTRFLDGKKTYVEKLHENETGGR